MKRLIYLVLPAVALTFAACSQSDTRTTTSDEVTDTNMTSVNRVRADDPDASIKVNVDTDEIKENLRDAAGATRSALERAGEKIRIGTSNFAEDVSKRLRDDPATSTSARNIEVTTSQGKVTLRGTVATEAEKKEFERKLREITDAAEVDNQLRVSAK